MSRELYLAKYTHGVYTDPHQSCKTKGPFYLKKPGGTTSEVPIPTTTENVGSGSAAACSSCFYSRAQSIQQSLHSCTSQGHMYVLAMQASLDDFSSLLLSREGRARVGTLQCAASPTEVYRVTVHMLECHYTVRMSSFFV